MVSGIDTSNIINQLMGNSTLSGSSASQAITAGANIFNAFLENFTDRYSNTANSDKVEEKQELIKSLVEKADTNNDGCLSIDELSSIDISDNSENSKLVSELKSNFISLDKNSDDVLSMEEMQELILKKRYSQQEISEMADSSDNSLKNISSFAEKLLNNYLKV